MLLMMHAKLRRPDTTSDKEFYRVWAEEAKIGLQALEAGTIQQLYKVAGKNEVIGIFEIDNGDDLDGFVYNALPFFISGNSNMVEDVSWTPIRPYENFAKQLIDNVDQDFYPENS